MAASDPKPAPGIEQVLAAMEKWEASDLFVSAGKAPAVRLHGAVVTLETPPMNAPDIERFLGTVLHQAQQTRLHEQGDVDFGYTLPNGKRFRLSVARQLGQNSIVARAVPKADCTLAELGLPLALGSFAEHTAGLVLVVGGSGSGKSTTLAALVHHINARRAAHIVTIEEPIEFLHADVRARITQREVGTDTPSYASALQNAARESPDVIMVAQLASPCVLRAALDAAARGQLVLAAVDASNTTLALTQLVASVAEAERGALAAELSRVLVGVAAQKLVPRKGVAGRVAVVEVLSASAELAELVSGQRFADVEALVRGRASPAVVCFADALLALYATGVISAEVAVANGADVAELARKQAAASATGLALARTVDIQTLLQGVIKRGASDLHLSVGRPPILRINGELEVQAVPALTAADLDAVLHSLLSVRKREAYDHEREYDFALSLPNGQRFRVNAYHERGQMAVAFRTITADIPDAAALGLPPAVLKMGEEPHGLLLVVGPTGSGKTTTLACLVDRINHTRPCHVITIEDPVEYLHQSDRATIHQREVGADTHSFAAALKYILRQDPDVVLIGELRDLETIAAALTAAETGHLVMATLHTNDAVQTIDRIIDVFPPHQQAQARSQLAASLIGVVSQRLLLRPGGAGRHAAFEVMVATPAIRTLVREAKMHQALGIMQTARGSGMVTMDQSLEDLVRRGAIDKDEAMRYMQNPANLEKPRGKATTP